MKLRHFKALLSNADMARFAQVKKRLSLVYDKRITNEEAFDDLLNVWFENAEGLYND